jgi:hypothetical protein
MEPSPITSTLPLATVQPVMPTKSPFTRVGGTVRVGVVVCVELGVADDVAVGVLELVALGVRDAVARMSTSVTGPKKAPALVTPSGDSN